MDMFGRQKLNLLQATMEAVLRALADNLAKQQEVEKKLDRILLALNQRPGFSQQGLIPIVAKPQVTKPSLTEVKKNDKSK